MSQKFEFKKQILDKSIYINLNGKFDKEDGLAYVDEYKKIMQSIDPKEYTLKFDCTNLAVSANDSLDILQSCFNMYSESKINKVIAILGPKQSVLAMQFKRLARNAGLTNFEVEK